MPVESHDPDAVAKNIHAEVRLLTTVLRAMLQRGYWDEARLTGKRIMAGPATLGSGESGRDTGEGLGPSAAPASSDGGFTKAAVNSALGREPIFDEEVRKAAGVSDPDSWLHGKNCEACEQNRSRIIALIRERDKAKSELDGWQQQVGDLKHCCAELEKDRDEARQLYTETEIKLALLQSPQAVQVLQQAVADTNDERDELKQLLQWCVALCRGHELTDAQREHARSVVGPLERERDMIKEKLRFTVDGLEQISANEKSRENDIIATDVLVALREDSDA